MRGRRYERASSRRSGRKVYGGHQQMRRGSGRASSLQSRSPIGTVGRREEDGWTEDNTLPTMHPFMATPGMTCPISTTSLGFFQLFIPFEMLVFFREETNDYAYYQCVKLEKVRVCMEWRGCGGHSAVLGHHHVDRDHRTPRYADVLSEEHDVQYVCISPEDVVML